MHSKKIVDIIGFTRTEFSIIIFLLGMFLLGLLVQYFSLDKALPAVYDYTRADSVFLSSLRNSGELSADAADDSIKVRVLGVREVPVIKKGPPPALYSLNINTADIRQFCSLPGIGEKTARKIIEARASAGGFRSAAELMEVKGIGPAKFRKIEKYLCTDNTGSSAAK